MELEVKASGRIQSAHDQAELGEEGCFRVAKSWVQGEGMWEIMKAGPGKLLCLEAVSAAMCNWIIEIRGEGWLGSKNWLQGKER